MRGVVRFLGTVAVTLGLAGVLLVAGWHFWPNGAGSQPGVPSAGRAGAALSDIPSIWLISPTGGPVPASDAQAYLLQDRSTPSRALTVTMVAPLEALLQDGETLPDPLYQEVMADIRASLLAQRLCPVLSASLAERCSVASAGVQKGSLDPVLQTAVFNLNIRYSQSSDPDELPDLARYVLRVTVVDLPEAAGPLGSVEDGLEALLAAAGGACQAEDAGQACRVLRLALEFVPEGPVRGQAVIGALYPLPETMRTAPELLPAPKG